MKNKELHDIKDRLEQSTHALKSISVLLSQSDQVDGDGVSVILDLVASDLNGIYKDIRVDTG